MILMDTPDSAQGVITTKYVVPAIHIPVEGRATLLAYVAKAPSPTALLEGTVVTYNAVAPAMAGFSSRGPVPVANGAVMKPDVTAPGVILFCLLFVETQVMFCANPSGQSAEGSEESPLPAMYVHTYQYCCCDYCCCAPGVDILAASAGTPPDEGYNYLSGKGCFVILSYQTYRGSRADAVILVYLLLTSCSYGLPGWHS